MCACTLTTFSSKILSTAVSFWIQNSAYAVSIAAVALTLRLSPAVILHTLHYKASPQCSYLLSRTSARDLKKMRHRAKYTAPFTYYVRVASPTHQEFMDCYNRIESLAGLSDCVRIARAGFFRNGKHFSCFDCGCTVSAFEDSPWKEHCLLSPNCRHLIQARGFYYIQKNL